MPVHTFSRNRYFRHEIRSSNRHPFFCRTPQRNPAYDSVFFRNLLLVEELTELLGLGLGRHSGCKSYSKPLLTSELNSFSCSHPRSGSAMKVVFIRCRAVEADCQNNSIAGRWSQGFRTTP